MSTKLHSQDAGNIDRRTFVIKSAVALAGLCTQSVAEQKQDASSQLEDFTWHTNTLRFRYSVRDSRLRQGILTPQSFSIDPANEPNYGFGVEVGLLCTGENSPDPGMKQSGGGSGRTLRFVAKTQSSRNRLTLEHHDDEFDLKVLSHYESYDDLPVVRRFVELINLGSKSVGIEYLSSAMLHGISDPGLFENEMKIWLAYNSWMAEGQWHCLRPSELGFVENERTSWSEAAASSVGSWSTEKYLPMSVVENTRLGLSWFWQIEHNGSWHWEISNVSESGNIATDTYLYFGGPDQLHGAAWKNLAPGATYRSVPVAIGCVSGGFDEAVHALTRYRKQVCIQPWIKQPVTCPIIFNDYMNCLWGDPTEAKELPLIDAAAAAGCEYYVIDAGWYAELKEDWSATVGSWLPSKARWPRGLHFVLDYIRERGMVPGLWIEPEVAGLRSTLAQKPDNWFFVVHGKRVVKNSRLFLDFRNPQVRAYLNAVVQRLVEEYKVGYLKMDYNADALEGTELDADSPGQGLLEHNRAVQRWLEDLQARYPAVLLENCGSGGGRMDYAMLSRMQLQSCTDQEDYLKLPAIATGSMAAVLPMQLALWSYPKANADADQASFNMVTAMLCRMHQSGDLASLKAEAFEQVQTGIRIYKNEIRKFIPDAIPFYPLGLPNVTDAVKPIALGIETPGSKFIAVWRLSGSPNVEIRHQGRNFKLLYPLNLGIHLEQSHSGFVLHFPRARMACIVQQKQDSERVQSS